VRHPGADRVAAVLQFRFDVDTLLAMSVIPMAISAACSGFDIGHSHFFSGPAALASRAVRIAVKWTASSSCRRQQLIDESLTGYDP